MSLLTLGEGNFTWALAVAESSGSPGSITATSYDSADGVSRKYGAKETAATLSRLRELGVRILHGIDATADLRTEALLPRDVFARVVFRHPHSGLKSVASNRLLLQRTFARVAELLASDAHCARDAVFEITIKTTGRYNEWTGGDLRTVAAESGGLVLIRVERPHQPAHYKHATTTGFDAGVKNDWAASWTFTRPRAGVVPLKKLPRWLFSELSDRCDRCGICDKIFSSLEDLRKHESGSGHLKRVQQEKQKKRNREAADKREAKKAKKKAARGNGADDDCYRRCEVCRVVINSEASWEMHVAGRKHREAAAAATVAAAAKR